MRNNRVSWDMTQWCTWEKEHYSQPVDTSEFVKGCRAATTENDRRHALQSPSSKRFEPTIAAWSPELLAT